VAFSRGPSDVHRASLQEARAAPGLPFIIENGRAAAAMSRPSRSRAPPADGHTLLMGTTASLHQTRRSTEGQFHRRPIRADHLMASTANILVVNPQLPRAYMAERIAHAKANPGKVQLSPHRAMARTRILRAELFKAGGQDRHSACALQGRGAGAAGRDRGARQMMFATAAAVCRNPERNRCGTLAVTTPSARGSPSWPTVDELPKGFDCTTGPVWSRPRAPEGRHSRRCIARPAGTCG